MLIAWAGTDGRAALPFGHRVERADITSNTYYDWMISRAYALVPAQAYVGQFLETFTAFPPRQKPASFTVGGQMEALETALSKLEGDIN